MLVMTVSKPLAGDEFTLCNEIEGIPEGGGVEGRTTSILLQRPTATDTKPKTTSKGERRQQLYQTQIFNNKSLVIVSVLISIESSSIKSVTCDTQQLMLGPTADLGTDFALGPFYSREMRTVFVIHSQWLADCQSYARQHSI